MYFTIRSVVVASIAGFILCHSALAQESDPSIDSANRGNTTKTWSSQVRPHKVDQAFLDVLKWEEHAVGKYTLRMGKIQDKWIAAVQFLQNGKVVLTEYTPPGEYITVVDALSGKPCRDQWARDANDDGMLEVAFLHSKLDDPQYHMYSIYRLENESPKLIWKSGGRLGDWLHQIDDGYKPGGLFRGGASRTTDD